MEVLDDPNRQLVVGDFPRLGVLPKPMFQKLTEEVQLMKAVRENAAENVACDSEVTEKAIKLASDYDVAPMDALHVGVAVTADVDEFVTLEKPTKPIYRVSEISVRSLDAEIEG